MNVPIDEFIGVYDADSTLWGEVSYWIGARIGRRHCSLCDITHGTFTVRKDWKQCSSELQVPFTTYHRNDAPADVLAAANNSFPVVLARRDQQIEVVATNRQLESLQGSATQFRDHLQSLLA
jgi:hypothetical protein